MAQQQTTITVNGRETQAPAGEILLETLRRNGIAVPTLCHDDRLTPYGGCRLCVVARRDGRGGLVPACSTPVQRGMVLETDAPEVIESRRKQLQLLVLNHRMECPVCERRGDCRLQDLVYEYGSPERQLPFELVRAPKDERSPVIVRDPEKCIICGKCVRICDEVQGVAAIGVLHRGLEARVSTLLDRPLDCEFCGQCVNACPVGALVARPYVSDVPAWQRESTTTTCALCSCGCQVRAETAHGALERVTSDADCSPNRGKLCVKGWLGWDILHDPDRLDAPLVKRDGRLEPTTWKEALQAVADAVNAAKASGRPVAGLGSSRLTCEDAYLMQRFMRSVVGTPHVDVGYVGGVPALVDGLGTATGKPASNANLEEMAGADLVLVLRGDPSRTHPLVKTELVQGVRQRGQKLILAHALSGGLERHAALHLPLSPGTEEILVRGVAARVLADHPERAEACRGVAGFAVWAEALAAYTPERVAGLTGVPAARISELADRLAGAQKVVTVVVSGLGIPGDEAKVTCAAVQMMALLCGPERPPVLVLGEKANVQGAIDVGLHPRLLPGHRPVDDEAARQEIANAWSRELPNGEGWSAREVFSRSARGEIGVLYLAGQDPIKALPQGLLPREAIEKPDFVLVQDAFLTETARLADVVLPVCILGERGGSLVGCDGVRRGLRRVPGSFESLPQDGEIFVELARRMGASLPAGEDLERELEQLVSWPSGGNAIQRFEPPGRPGEPAEWSGMLLDASPQLFHSGSVTLRSATLQQLSPTVAVRVSPRDARELGVRNGEPLRVATDERELLLRARLDRTVRPGTIVVSWQGGRGGSAATLTTEIGQALTVSVRRPQ